VQAVADASTKQQVATDAGTRPVWSRDGRELFYLGAGRLWSVAVTTTGESTFEAAAPKELFDIRVQRTQGFDVDAEGRFIMAVETANPLGLPMTIVTNWSAALARH
jgi:hypothetical protein